MKRVLFAAAAFLWGAPVEAQTLIYPPLLNGEATMTATTSSLPINSTNLTLVPGSSAFPTGNLPNKYMRVKVLNSQGAMVTVCWTGGSCVFGAGEVIAIGESDAKGIAWNVGTTPPTVVSQSGSVVIEVEW